MEQLSNLGWTGECQLKWQELSTTDLRPGRVVADFGTSLKVAMPEVYTAELTGKMAHYSNRQNVPKVGDWVAVRLFDDGHAIVEAVVPRRSELSRKTTGNKSVRQVIAANIDIAFVLLSLDEDFSVKRLERFLFQLSANHISPVIVLNKADKPDSLTHYTDQLSTLELPIIITSARTGEGIGDILKHLQPGQTAILLGSSGVGKSTLMNILLGREAQATQEVRASDSTGRHTTVHRELFALPGGGLLIDTPGIRELQLWGGQEDLDENFDDIQALVASCKYTTCRHNGEEGCAIAAALADGTLESSRYDHYLKMKNELAGLEKRTAAFKKRDNRKSRASLRRQASDTRNDLKDQDYYIAGT